MQNKIKLRVTVKNSNDFIQKLILLNINLYDIQQKENQLEIIVEKDDYEQIKKIKTINEIRIINVYGIEKIKEWHHKYKIIGLSFLIGMMINIILSHIILKVDIKTSNLKIEKYVRKEVYALGLKPFHFKKKQKEINHLKKELLEKKKIEWLEIEEKGTKYIITVEEKKETMEKQCPNRNIVAKKKAMITKIESSNGEIVKKKNDYVEKGDVIISGTIHNKEEIVSQKCAEGKVLGETWYRVKVEIPQEVKTIKKIKKYKWKIHIGKKDFEEDGWIIKKEYNIIKSNLYPIRAEILYLQQIEIKNRNYTKNNVETIAYKNAEELLKKRFRKEPNIIKKKVLKKSIKNSKIIVEVFFALEEDITSYQPINEEMKEK